PAVVRQTGAVAYAELHCHSNFSFLDGASHTEELVEEAARLGLDALALTDHDGMYGVVRFAEAAKILGVPTVFGAELTLGLTKPQTTAPAWGRGPHARRGGGGGAPRGPRRTGVADPRSRNASSMRSSGPSVATMSPSRSGTTATRSTRRATTPSSRWRRAQVSMSSPPTTSTTPIPTAGRSPPPSPQSAPVARSTSST